MKRPLFVIGSTFACTTWLAFLFDYTTALLLSGALSATALLLLLPKRPGLRLPCLILLSGALALGAHCLWLLRAELPFRELEGKTVEVQGLVLEAEGNGRWNRCTLLGDFLSEPGLPGGQRIVLTYYGEQPFQPGRSVRCLARAALPGGTASAQYYRSQGVAVTGTVRGRVHEAEQSGLRPRAMLVRLRARMQENLQRRLPEESARIVGAVVLGLQSGVDADVYTDVSRAGTAHLLAVSGLHLSVLTAALLGLLQRLRVPRAPRYLCAMAAALAFAGLVGFSPSIMRALVMTCLLLCGRLLSRRSDPLNSLGLALLLLCTACPHWTLGRSLWLSASSTLGIITLYPRAWAAVRRRLSGGQAPAGRVLHRFLQAAVLSACAYAASLPFMLLFTGWITPVSPLANMLIAPFILPLLLGGIACALLPAALPLGAAAAVTHFCAAMVLGVSRALVRLPFAAIALDEAYLLLLAAAFAAGIAVLVGFRADRRLTAYFFALCVLCGSAGHLSLLYASRDRVELAVLERCDAAVLLRGGSAVILGAPTRANIDRLTSYLDFRGVSAIAAVVAPAYPDNVDSGLLRLADRYGIGCFVGPDDAYVLAGLERALPGTRVFSGGYATVQVLDAALIDTGEAGQLRVRVGGLLLLKNDAEYAIIEEYEPDCIEIYGGGVLLLPAGTSPAVEPVGRRLFGEARVLLDIR